MPKIIAFFDESGDLGWKLDAPYRKGGSSRFFSIASVHGDGDVHRRAGKVIKKLWAEQGWTSKHEKKWNNISATAKLNFCTIAAEFAKNNTDIKLSVAVVEKAKVAVHLRPDQHLFYAHLATQLIVEDLLLSKEVSVCPDELNAGTGSANLLQHLLRHELWFKRGCAPTVKQISQQSAFVQALEFCDMLAGAAASHFEDGVSDPWNEISPYVQVRYGV